MGLNVPESNRLYITLGNNLPLYITLYNDLSQYDLTGAKVWFTVKRNITDPDSSAVIQKISTGALSVVDPKMGLIRINLLTSDTSNLENSWYYSYIWDIKVLDTAGNLITTTYGSLGVVPGITGKNS